MASNVLKPWSKFLVNAEIVHAYTQEQAMHWYHYFHNDPILRCYWLGEMKDEVFDLRG